MEEADKGQVGTSYNRVEGEGQEEGGEAVEAVIEQLSELTRLDALVRRACLPSSSSVAIHTRVCIAQSLRPVQRICSRTHSGTYGTKPASSASVAVHTRVCIAQSLRPVQLICSRTHSGMYSTKPASSASMAVHTRVCIAQSLRPAHL